MHKIGCRILMSIGILFVGLGLYAVLFNSTPLFSIIDTLMDPNFWEQETLSPGTLKFKVFTWDFLGMFHIIWGINLIYVAKSGLLKRREASAWWTVLLSVATWLTVDAVFTIAVGQNRFLPVTVFFAVLFIIPLAMTGRVLKHRSSDTSAKAAQTRVERRRYPRNRLIHSPRFMMISPPGMRTSN